MADLPRSWSVLDFDIRCADGSWSDLAVFKRLASLELLRRPIVAPSFKSGGPVRELVNYTVQDSMLGALTLHLMNRPRRISYDVRSGDHWRRRPVDAASCNA